jgi:hypothetical protein
MTTLVNDCFNLSKLYNSYYRHNSLGWNSSEFINNTGVCVGACDLGGIRYSSDELYWSDYFKSYNALGASNGPSNWILDKLEKYVEQYNPHTILFVISRLSPQKTIMVDDQIVSLTYNNPDLIRFLYIKRKISREQRDEYIREMNRYTLDSIIESENFQSFIDRLYSITVDRRFRWTNNLTQISVDYWEKVLPIMLSDKYMRENFIGSLKAIDYKQDGAIGCQTSELIYRAFNSTL